MRLHKYTALFTQEKGEEGVYNVTFPALPEIATFGESIEEARFMAQEALELSVASRLEEGEIVPKDKKPARTKKGTFTEEIFVSVSHHVSSTPVNKYAKAAHA